MAIVARVVAAGFMAGLVSLVGGCISQRVPPTLEIRETRVQQLEWNGTTFTVLADVTNKDANPITIETADYGLSIDGIRVATGSTRVRLVINPGETMSIALPVKVYFYAISNIIQQHRELVTPSNQIGGTLQGVARGTNGFETVTTPIEGTVTIPLTKEAWSGTFPGIKQTP